ncbi:MAG: hypothetical protein JSS66_00955 [Armatimonadetes bacterium]|nr:hypothetical protein [Armatimonadota bacterium]
MNNFSRLALAGLSALAVGEAHAANVYVMSSGSQQQDTAVVAALAAAGHSSFIGDQFSNFDGNENLTGFDSILLQVNYNWNSPDMPVAGQNRLVTFVQQGGGLVTTEWVLWDISAQAKFQVLNTILPSVATASYNGDAFHHLVQVTADTIINSGMPLDFEIPGDNVAGSETNVPDVKPGGLVFYSTLNSGNFCGLTGWNAGLGRVAQFSQTVGEAHLADPLGFRLLGNVIEWVSHGAAAIQLSPDTVTVRIGQTTSGGLGQISDIDGQVMRVCKFIVVNQQVAPVTVEVEGACPFGNPATMQFRTYSRQTVSGAFQMTVDLYDWSTNLFSTTAVRTDPIGTNFKAVAVNANAPVSRFVSGSGRVKARYRVKQAGPGASSAWCNDLDQAVWFVKP